MIAEALKAIHAELEEVEDDVLFDTRGDMSPWSIANLIVANQGVLNRNIARVLRALVVLGAQQVSALDDLKAAEQEDAAATAEAVQKISDLGANIEDLATKLEQAITGGNSTDIASAASAIRQHATDLRAAVTAVSAPPAEGSAREELGEDAKTEAVEDAPPAPPVP